LPSPAFAATPLSATPGSSTRRPSLDLSLRNPATYRQYVTLWSSAARSGWGIAGVFDGSGDSLDELHRLIARREIDVVLAWRADHLGRSLLDAIGATGCGLYEPGARSPDVKPEQNVQTGLTRARAQGKRLGRPRIDGATEDAIRAALATGKGIRKVAREVGVGTSTVQRVRAERTDGELRPRCHPHKRASATRRRPIRHQAQPHG
jgi:DNA invertase Pin-like site-specific DNA recombinase